jgi:hypothetical protein
LPAAMVWPMEKVKGWKQDIDCLAAMWLRGVQGKSHKERLEFFYGPQAHACEFVISLRFPGPVDRMSPGERGGRLPEACGLLEFVLFIVSESLSFQAWLSSLFVVIGGRTVLKKTLRMQVVIFFL